MTLAIDHRALRDRIEYLEEENRQLRQRLTAKDGEDFCLRAHRAFGLTKAEGRILAVLVRCGLAETSALYDALYGFNELDEPERPNEDGRQNLEIAFAMKTAHQMMLKRHHMIYLHRDASQNFQFPRQAVDSGHFLF